MLKQKSKSFEDFAQALADMGFEFKDGKQPVFKGKNQKRFIRLRSTQADRQRRSRFDQSQRKVPLMIRNFF